jgi:hypothetical protein
MIFGQSHARGCAAELGHLLKKDFEVLGSITPGSGMRHIRDSSTSIIKQLSKEDAVVIWGGSNDIAKNNASTGMKPLLDLVINATHANIILMSAPHSFDLMETSCVNKEIENFNNKLHTKLERFGKAEMIEVDNDGTLFTTHGQHLNSRGKENMANKTASMIKRMLAKKVKPISAKWYPDNETPEMPTPTTNNQISTMPRNKDPEMENEQAGTQNLDIPEITPQSPPSMSLEKPSGEAQDQTTSSTKEKDGEIKIDHPHPTKQQRKKTNTKGPGFFMDNVTTGSTVTHACKPLQPAKQPCSLNAIQQINVNTPSIST